MNAKREHERQLIELHRLLVDGKGDTPEHEALCESMVDSWEQLDEPTRELFRRLSSDLDTLDGTQRLKPTAQEPQELGLKLGTAWKRNDFQSVLELLRKVQTPYLTPEGVAFLRGQCWAALGFREAAGVFYSHAADLLIRMFDKPEIFVEMVASDRIDDLVNDAPSIDNLIPGIFRTKAEAMP